MVYHELSKEGTILFVLLLVQEGSDPCLVSQCPKVVQIIITVVTIIDLV